LYFQENNNVLYWLESEGRNGQQELYEIDLEDRNATLIYRSINGEIAAVVGNPVMSIMENYVKPKRTFLDPNG